MTSVAWLMISVCLVLTLPSFPFSHSSFFRLPWDRMGIFHVEEWQCGWSELPALPLLFLVRLKRSPTVGLSPSGLPSSASAPLHPSVIHREPGWKIPYFLSAFFFFPWVIFNSDLSADPADCTAREIPPPPPQENSRTEMGGRDGSHGPASAGGCQDARAWEHILLERLEHLRHSQPELGPPALAKCAFLCIWSAETLQFFFPLKLYKSCEMADACSCPNKHCCAEHNTFPETHRKVILITSPIPYVSGSLVLIWSYSASVPLIDSKHRG